MENNQLNHVQIKSCFDGKMQNAYFYPASGAEKKPLVVSLHQWSFDYRHAADPSSLADRAVSENWNFIYPDFRGANNNPEACLSEAAIHDIDDAIDYALENGNADRKKIVVAGVSGGGMAALGAYMRSSYDLFYCMAWCPVCNLEDWYFQTKRAGLKYWKEVMNVTGSNGSPDTAQARKRSPLFMDVPQRPDTLLELFTGINDGYTGSVPVLHLIQFYNKIAKHMNAAGNDFISDADTISLLSRSINDDLCDEYLGDRKVLYKKSFKNICMRIFDGTHEILSEYAFARIRDICRG